MDLFVPWANAMLMQQMDTELPVQWDDLIQRYPTVQTLALKLVRFFDANVHWKHRDLYHAVSVVAGLVKKERKDLNSLDLRIRVESFLEMKLRGESYETKWRRKKQEEAKMAEVVAPGERVVYAQIPVYEEVGEIGGRKKKRKNRRERDEEKASRKNKQSSKHKSEKAKGERDEDGDDDGKKRGKSKKSKKKKSSKKDRSEKEVVQNGDASLDEKRKTVRFEDKEIDETKNRNKNNSGKESTDSGVGQNDESPGDHHGDVNNNSTGVRLTAEAGNHGNLKSSNSTTPVVDWDPNSEEYLV